MIEALSSALSGLRAYANQASVTASNISNLNTPGFNPSRAVSASVAAGGVTSTTQTPAQSTTQATTAQGPLTQDPSLQAMPEVSNVDLGGEMVNLIQAKHGYSAQTSVIKASDEMLGSLMDIKT